MIDAANKIRTKPYIWGGGHGRWWDRGYDCSGAVSFALHGGKLLASPMPSGPMARWGKPGPGRWITVYANARPRLRGDRRPALGHRRQPQRQRPALARGPRRRGQGAFVARHPPGY